jgi:membrane peptidoglycan carboxypeptidase
MAQSPNAPPPHPSPKRRRPSRFVLGGTALLFLLLALAIAQEMRGSFWQSRLFADATRGLAFSSQPGPATFHHFPGAGPYDLRLGYAHLPRFIARAQGAGFVIDHQARWSHKLQKVVEWGLFLPYREKRQAGLSIFDRSGNLLFHHRYPKRIYPDFDSIPALLVDTLLFIENRELLNPRHPYRNPAVEWDRLARAVAQKLLSLAGRREVIGGSTLATQIEKYRHSARGVTDSPLEKLRQMLSATLRAYLDGPNTLAAQRRIVVDYISSVPLAAAPGYGEVHGLGDGMEVWYGTDFDTMNRLLADPWGSAPQAQALAFKRALSLFLAQRRPSYYLTEGRPELEKLTDAYLRTLACEGTIDPELRDVALGLDLQFRTPTVEGSSPFPAQKSTNLVRYQLAALLGLESLYELDRLDLTVQATLARAAQRTVTEVLRKLRDPDYAEAAGLTADARLLARGDPSQVLYSFILFEQQGGANRLRVLADNLDQPLDVNRGVKLDLGSTAKLRTLITYLEVIATLYERYALLPPKELRTTRVSRRDRLAQWVVYYLRQHREHNLITILQASMDRRYSASPHQTFFTGGGQHVFKNFNRHHDGQRMSVRTAFRHSVNLVFIRLMRDIVRHYMYQTPGSKAELLEDRKDPRRIEYLARFADLEGTEFIRRFFAKYEGNSPDEALDKLLRGTRLTPKRLAVILRSADPLAPLSEFERLLALHLPGSRLSAATVGTLYEKYAIDNYSLMDRSYLARVHPLELWLLHHLRRKPGAPLAEVIEASAHERQEVYRWLFRTRHKRAQDRRIRTLLELEAFLEIHRTWQRLGYPFESLTPSLATAIGSSGDRPAALAELMGIIVNDGWRYPTITFDQLHFAARTPYETRLRLQPHDAHQVLAPEIAAVVRKALVDVVETGTARRLARMRAKDEAGPSLVVGGKTGTGDHRHETYNARGHRIASRVVNRAATFVFEIDDRFFGTVSAFVLGPDAAHFKFTSSLPVQILGTLLPALEPLLTPAPTSIEAVAQRPAGQQAAVREPRVREPRG